MDHSVTPTGNSCPICGQPLPAAGGTVHRDGGFTVEIEQGTLAPAYVVNYTGYSGQKIPVSRAFESVPLARRHIAEMKRAFRGGLIE